MFAIVKFFFRDAGGSGCCFVDGQKKERAFDRGRVCQSRLGRVAGKFGKSAKRLVLIFDNNFFLRENKPISFGFNLQSAGSWTRCLAGRCTFGRKSKALATTIPPPASMMMIRQTVRIQPPRSSRWTTVASRKNFCRPTSAKKVGQFFSIGQLFSAR